MDNIFTFKEWVLYFSEENDLRKQKKEYKSYLKRCKKTERFYKKFLQKW